MRPRNRELYEWPLAMNIVNQLFDRVFEELPGAERLPKYAQVDARQKVNDECDKFVSKLLREFTATVGERVAKAIEGELIPNESGVGEDARLLNDGIQLAAGIAREVTGGDL